MMYLLYPLLYVTTLSLVSVLMNWGVFLPWYTGKGYPIDMLSVTVYSIYFCLKYVSVCAALLGLGISFFREYISWKTNTFILIFLSLIVFAVQAYFFPRS